MPYVLSGMTVYIFLAALFQTVCLIKMRNEKKDFKRKAQEYTSIVEGIMDFLKAP